MKQEITPEQLSELSDGALLRLCDWKTKKNIKADEYNVSGKGYAPLLSIGQMIQFLDEKHALNKELWEEMYYSEKYCELLWDSVKEVLENK